MEDILKESLLLHANIHRIHTTPLGNQRICKNLNLKNTDAVQFCINIILNSECTVHREGKNWYCEADGLTITINSSSCTIITAHRHRKKTNLPQ
ncbi:DUF3781 domain-containing protein [Ruminobacter sp.]|uniref:DUF3781 domain-containing protein n=1 Tax=Ruminobacter sp. TaxID=2774296 RepID=UPI00386AAB0F